MDGKVAIVTGASSGIGAAIAQRFGSGGFRNVLFARRIEALEGVERGITQNGGEAFCVAGDVTRREDVTRCVEQTLTRWGRIDVLVNNAGMGRRRGIEEITEADFDELFSVNVKGPLLMTQAVLPTMKVQKAGQIINVGSMAGMVGIGGSSLYSATKWALRGLNESWREELYPFGIKVAYLAPGYVLTPFGRPGRDLGQAPEKEWAMAPEDIAEAAWMVANQGKNADVRDVVIQVLDRS